MHKGYKNLKPLIVFLKAEQGIIQLYFRKIALQQQKFLVVLLFSNSL